MEQVGLQIEWYENGEKSAEVSFKNGLPYNGKKWLPNGEVCPVSSLTNGTGYIRLPRTWYVR